MNTALKTPEQLYVRLTTVEKSPVSDRRRREKTAADEAMITYAQLYVAPTKLSLVSGIVKRLIDIAGAGIGLVAISPFLVGVAIAIKMTSKGPVFFAQDRVGMSGRIFKMYKFRTMVINAEELKARLAAQNEHTDGPIFKMKKDPRITKIGAVLRKYSIDELPQLWNVFKGDMTLVGPSPAVPQEVAKYKMWQTRRLEVKPG